MGFGGLQDTLLHDINRELKDSDYHLSAIDEVELTLFGECTACRPSLSKAS